MMIRNHNFNMYDHNNQASSLMREKMNDPEAKDLLEEVRPLVEQELGGIHIKTPVLLLGNNDQEAGELILEVYEKEKAANPYQDLLAKHPRAVVAKKIGAAIEGGYMTGTNTMVLKKPSGHQDNLKSVLAHELVHAAQDQRYPQYMSSIGRANPGTVFGAFANLSELMGDSRRKKRIDWMEGHAYLVQKNLDQKYFPGAQSTIKNVALRTYDFAQKFSNHKGIQNLASGYTPNYHGGANAVLLAASIGCSSSKPPADLGEGSMIDMVFEHPEVLETMRKPEQFKKDLKELFDDNNESLC